MELIDNAINSGDPINTGYVDEDISHKHSPFGCKRDGCMKGYIEVNGKMEYCQCYKDHLFYIQLKKSRIPHEYHDVRSVKEEGLKVMKKAYSEPIEKSIHVNIKKETVVLHHNFEKLIKNGWNFMFEGPTGTGKTTLTTILSRIALKNNYTVLFLELEELRRLWTGEELDKDLEKAKKLLYKVDVLILDDLGKEFKSERSEYFITNFDSLIRQRIANNKMNIFSTNLTIENLLNRYDERVVSLLKKNMIHYVMHRKYDLRDENGLPDFLI